MVIEFFLATGLIFELLFFFFNNVIFHQELDFLVEAKNSEKCLDNFRKLSPHLAEYVYAPTIYWNLTSSKLLTMEFMDGAQVNDVATIKKLGIQPFDVSKLVSSYTFDP